MGGRGMSKLYSPEEIADFLFEYSDLGHAYPATIINAITEWSERTEAGHEVPNKKLTIIGRERWLLDDLAKGIQGVIGGPPPSKKTMARVRRHNSSTIYDTSRGNKFEVQVVDSVTGKPTGHIARVTVELDRFEEVR